MKTLGSAQLITTLKLWLSCIVEWLLFLPVWIVLQKYLQPRYAVLPWISTLPLVSMTDVLLREKSNPNRKQLPEALIFSATAGSLAGAYALVDLPLFELAAICDHPETQAVSASPRIGYTL
ncbi:hypothetical protein AMQ83_07365, partial [Paenibacillus riograndensis]